MLMIARRVGETLRIGSNVTVTVREIRGKQVRLAISAPESVQISRSELEENGAAAESRSAGPPSRSGEGVGRET